MLNTWTAEEKTRYRRNSENLMRNGSRSIALLAMTLFPAFAFLDYFAHYEQVRELFFIRAITTILFFVEYFFYLNKKEFSNPYVSSITLLSWASLSITLMCIQTGGVQSPYYAGINLVILAAVLVLPIKASKTLILSSIIIGIYLVGMLYKSGWDASVSKNYLNNLYFLISTSIIGVTAAHLTEKMRVDTFDQHLKREKVQADLERSKNLLQNELQSEQVNVELLIKEITVRRMELEKALTLRDEFISVASHELNTPLTALKLQTELVKRRIVGQKLDQSGFENMVDYYDRQTKRLIRIVGDMLDISRINNGKFELVRNRVDIEALIKDVIDRISVKSDGNEIHFESKEAIHGEWDAFRIEQVILNLLSNAIKYGNKKPIKIELRRDEKMAVIQVIDQGIGIPNEHLPKLFKRFERAVKAQQFSGLGLGLYITKQIVDAHDGSIEVESVSDQGSTFIVRLPLVIA